VLVIDGNPEVYERAVDDFGGHENVVISDNDENQGISYSRTRGAELASGEIVAFIDDDGVAEEDWIAKLVEVYEETDAIAVGGDVRPNWQGKRPDFFPEEFYWLVGCVEPGIRRGRRGGQEHVRVEHLVPPRGISRSWRVRPEHRSKGRQASAGSRSAGRDRLMEEFGQGMVYTGDAVVHHTLSEYRGEFRWLLFRSFWQGYSKRVMDLLYPDAPDAKGDYLKWLLTDRIPRRLEGLVRSPSTAAVAQLGAIAVFTLAVGLGYLYAMATPELVEKANA